MQTVTHLELAGADGKQAARHLKRLIPLKNRAEYDPAPLRGADAASAVKAAERIVEIAGAVVAENRQRRDQNVTSRVVTRGKSRSLSVN